MANSLPTAAHHDQQLVQDRGATTPPFPECDDDLKFRISRAKLKAKNWLPVHLFAHAPAMRHRVPHLHRHQLNLKKFIIVNLAW
jgi:hypothetical protein